MPKKQLEERFRFFQLGEWMELLAKSSSIDAQAHQLSSRRRRRQQQGDEERRSDRARSLVHMGELSAARGALEATPVAPGTMAMRKLTDPAKRPPVAKVELCQEVVDAVPERAFQLDPEEFLVCFRTTRQGSAAGPSGMTADHLFPILENDRDSILLVVVVSSLATRNVITEIIDGIRLGRMTALQKPDGGVRGIVVGDIDRRLVAKQVEQTTTPFQYALVTRARCECIAHTAELHGHGQRCDHCVHYAILVVKLDGKALGIFQLMKKREGLEAWRQLKLEYEGKSGNRQAALLR